MENELKDFEVKMVYRNGTFPPPDIEIQCYREELYLQAQDLESELFYEFRRKYNFTPYRINETPAEEVIKIKQYFETYKDTFYFLFLKGEYIGHLLLCHNSIESLCIKKRYQGQGYGSKLTKYAINKAIENGHEEINLIVFKDNYNAISMYKHLGFSIE